MVKILIFTEVLKDLSSWLLECNATISFQVIPSTSDPANLPSHTLCDKDCMLSEYAWVKVAHRFGPHMLDLMSLDSNVQKDAAGILLRHFTTHSTLFSAGINVFAQAVSSEDIYIFAPFVVVGPLLRFLEAANISSTIKVPQLVANSGLPCFFMHTAGASVKTSTCSFFRLPKTFLFHAPCSGTSLPSQ